MAWAAPVLLERRGGGGPGPALRPAVNTQEPRSFNNLLQGHHSRSKNICICKLPIFFSPIQVTSASNKIDCLFSLQTGSSPVESNTALAPKSQSILSWPGCGPSAHQGPFAHVSSGLKEGGGYYQSHPTPEVWSLSPPVGGAQLPHSSFCSVARPELQGPLSCWPGSHLLLTRWPLLALLQPRRPGVAAHSLSCLQPPTILPPTVS